jgi:hypothetical protein
MSRVTIAPLPYFVVSDRGHKRKRTRSLQDSPIDLGMALDCLEDGQEELGGIAEPEEESHAISSHVLALENILNSSAKKRVRCVVLALHICDY